MIGTIFIHEQTLFLNKNKMDANFIGQGGEAQRLWMFSAMAGGKPDRTTVQNISLPVYDPPTKGSRPDNWDLSKLFDQLTVECR